MGIDRPRAASESQSRPSDAATLPAWLPALMQLSSPAFPIGAFSYSQGLEAACEAKQVVDEEGACAWIGAQWAQSFSVRELPAVLAAWDAIAARDPVELSRVNACFIASRDTLEARQEARQVGAALARWLRTIAPDSPEHDLMLQNGLKPCAPVGWALCAHQQGIPRDLARVGWAFAWIENQVQCAVKLVPLGQTAGQRLLLALRGLVFETPPSEGWAFAPIGTILQMRHERQYTRIFRS